ncbi:MAG TPA: hypothetical protein VKE51_39580 [Vicinamibacterales bacterium]|nr:hypothetical protein [Vicinamibacterales bacterium]
MDDEYLLVTASFISDHFHELFTRLREEQLRASQNLVSRRQALVTPTMADEAKEGILHETEVVLHVDRIGRMETDLYIGAVVSGKAKHRGC